MQGKIQVSETEIRYIIHILFIWIIFTGLSIMKDNRDV